MNKSLLLFLCVLSIYSNKLFAQAQPCASDEVRKGLIEKHPEILTYEAELKRQINENIKKIDFKGAFKTTDTTVADSFWYDVPVVVHIIHDFQSEYISDDSIFHCLKLWNVVYAGANSDTAQVIPTFKKWIGNPHIRLHLATIDPYGNPTKGITRHRSYLTYNATDQAKLDDWPNTSYLNLWFTNSLAAQGGFQPAAYAYFPATGAVMPYYDGVICFSSYINVDKTVNHEIGHCFSLYHPWGSNNAAGAGTCADGGTDEVDDTPPTLGHLSCTLYDTTCATNYYVLYTTASGGDSLVDYPDTTNVQNIMDYSYCSKMFTKGQVVRMHAALNADVASRNNLWSATNLAYTGALGNRPDLVPIPDFNAVPKIGAMEPKFFTTSNFNLTPNGPLVKFFNESWNDTISFVNWHFSNGAKIVDTAVSPKVQIVNSFSQPGWASITMTATDTSGASAGRPNNIGTKTFSTAIFVADSLGVNADGYYQEFDPSGDRGKWPTFNYYNNEFKWALCDSAGYYDNYSMAYIGYDSRLIPTSYVFPPTGAPGGDFDDFYTVPFDLSSFSSEDKCSLNFMYSGAARSSQGLNVNDSLEIQYSIDGCNSWKVLYSMQKSVLDNMGAVYTYYKPSKPSDWNPMSIPITDTNIRKSKYVLLRFRYFPGNATSGYLAGFSSGNNFYIDRINFNRFPASVESVAKNNATVTIAPNPTAGNAFVIINDKNATHAVVEVMDITGKIVFKTSESLTGLDSRIEIPKSAIEVKGVYLIRTNTGNNSNTQKLVVY